MRKVNLITDCTSDLNDTLLKQHNVRVLPLYVSFGGASYRDGIDITTEELYQKVQETGKLPKSAAIPPALFAEVFESYPQDEDIIYIGIGSGFSASYNNAYIASQDYENVYLIDSQNLSSGIGILLLQVCAFRDQGLSAKEIVEQMKPLLPLVRTQFAINTLEYLHMGGRCSGTARIFGTLLKIKPIIRVVDNAMQVAKKPRGKFEVALKTLLDYVRADLDRIDGEYMFVTHSLANKDAQYLIKALKELVQVKHIIETKASGVISTHCGPRTIGIIYMLKQ